MRNRQRTFAPELYQYKKYAYIRRCSKGELFRRCAFGFVCKITKII